MAKILGELNQKIALDTYPKMEVYPAMNHIFDRIAELRSHYRNLSEKAECVKNRFFGVEDTDDDSDSDCGPVYEVPTGILDKLNQEIGMLETTARGLERHLDKLSTI